MPDRPYQLQAKTNILAEFEQGVHRQVIVMSTGCGKTHTFSGLPSLFNGILTGKMLVFVHRQDIVLQIAKAIAKENPFLCVEIEMGAKYKADFQKADIVVASIQSLTDKRTSEYQWNLIDKVVCDEVHRGVTESYLKIYEKLGLLDDDWKGVFIGCTATPNRADGEPLAKVFQKITFTYPIRQAIEEGWLVDVRGYKITTKTSLEGVKSSNGDFDTRSLSEAVNTPARNKQALKAYLDYGENKQFIGFTVDIQHAKDAALVFQEAGLNVVALWGDDPDRTYKTEAFANGEIHGVFNCDVWSEGYDNWRVACIIRMAPTKSPVKFTQQVGRATRLQDGTGNLLLSEGDVKRYCIILDMVDAKGRHSLVTLPTLLGLASDLDLNGKSLVGAVKRIEEAQEKYPHLKFDDLDNIDNIESFIESVNLFEIRFAPEVETNSEFSWYSSPTGGYVLMLPNKDKITITQNLLDIYEICGSIRGKVYKGERKTIEDAFGTADKLIRDLFPEVLKVVKREETWHHLPPTTGQLKLIGKFYKGKAIPNDLSRGQASRLIGAKLAGKA